MIRLFHDLIVFIDKENIGKILEEKTIINIARRREVLDKLEEFKLDYIR